MFERKFLKSGALGVSLLFCLNLGAQEIPIKKGIWKAELRLNDSVILPFRFNVLDQDGKLVIEIKNADERILVEEISFVKDSLRIKMPVFDSYFECKIDDDSLQGRWINNSRKDKNILPFKACHFESGSFAGSGVPDETEQSRYKVVFSPGMPNQSFAVGLFKTSKEGLSTGTFTTEGGDYRYLEGFENEKMIQLSCFDGSHAFLFSAQEKGDSLVNGHFYSGSHFHENWVAVRNQTFELRNPDSLTYLQQPGSKINFSFKNTEGKPFSLTDKRYQNKVVLIQLTGTWCPNCMDETKYLATLYDEYQKEGLEIIALAFERTDNFDKARENVLRTKKRFNVKYEYLLTMKKNAADASELFPVLSKITAFPTTIYLDRSGNVRKIYTGYYGPATGKYHTDYIKETEKFLKLLLNEEF